MLINMTNEEFVNAVKGKLKQRGLPEDFIDNQCEKLLSKINDLPSETAEKYAAETNVELIAGKIAEKFSSEAPKKPSPQSTTADKTRTVDMSHPVSETVSPTPKKSSTSDMIVIYDRESSKKKKSSLPFGLTFGDGIASDNDHPVLLFAALIALLAPVGIMVFGVSFIAFLTVFLVLAAAIVLMVAVIIGVVGVGSLISVASLMYGATQEIGLGLLVAGITIFVSVVLYNIALRLVPFIYAKLITFINFSYKKVREIFIKAKKGCENL